MAGIFRNMVESGALQRLTVVASILVHIVVIGWLMFGAPVKLFEPSQPAAITVELVSPDEIARKTPEEQKPDQEKTSQFELPDISAASTPPENAPPPPPPPTPQTAETQATSPEPVQPPQSPAPVETPAPQPQQMPAIFGAPVTKPDLTEQYGTFFQPFDAGGYEVIKEQTKLKSEVVTAFRNHLKSCSVRPAELSSSDNVRVVIRVALRRDGRLAAPPALVEAKASAKGPILMQAAIKALQSCQPYSMLPADKYDEWKVLDLDFSPADFSAG
jgi:outer membrane biosynthesis protein TonB